MLTTSTTVNGTGAVCDQKSKFFISHQKEPMGGHMVGVKGVY
jgi:hypothetical protein